MNSNSLTSHSGESNWEAVRDAAIQLIERREFDEAIALLKGATNDPRGEISQLLGVANFLTGNYVDSAKDFESALTLDPENPARQQLHQMALGNLVSRVDVPVPDFYHFDREKLLASASLFSETLPSSPCKPLPHSPLRRFCLSLGRLLGKVGRSSWEP